MCLQRKIYFRYSLIHFPQAIKNLQRGISFNSPSRDRCHWKITKVHINLTVREFYIYSGGIYQPGLIYLIYIKFLDSVSFIVAISLESRIFERSNVASRLLFTSITFLGPQKRIQLFLRFERSLCTLGPPFLALFTSPKSL